MPSLFEQYLEQADHLLSLSSLYDREAREIARQRFIKEGLPTIQNEDWRYAVRSVLLKQPFLMQADILVPVTPVPESALPRQSSDRLTLICLDGQFYGIEQLVLPKGLRIEPINAVTSAKALECLDTTWALAERLGHAFYAFNQIFSQSGLHIIVEDNCTIEPVIELQYLFSETDHCKEPGMFCVHNVIQAGTHSQVKIIESFIPYQPESLDTDKSRFAYNVLNRVTLKAGSQVEWGQAAATSARGVCIGQLAIQQAEDSSFRSESLLNGGGLMRHTLSVDLCGKGAVCDLYGLNQVKGQQHVDQQVLVHHRANHTHSNIHYRGIADEKGQLSFNGAVKAATGIEKMRSHQGNYNLLLSDTAEINTKPRLELLTGEIECTHGATVGALDAEALFYLKARGVPSAVARALLIDAFKQAICQLMPVLSAYHVASKPSEAS